MVRYSDELIEEIKNRNDIVDVVSQYVTLKKKGRNYVGLCPFHSEKSPSFTVSPEKQICHCFGCNNGGNVISFIGKIENVGFRESLEILAERANIELPKDDSQQDDKLYQLKDKVYQINKIAAEFYHQNLYKPTAKPAQEYVKKRKLDNNTLKGFLIGYAGNYNELYLELKKNGFQEEEILVSALVYKTDDGKFIDAFRKRLMFPIRDARGKVIAFGGRVLDDSKPKYKNSPDTVVYNKGRHLFALYNARQHDTSKILIVEGYMDVISLHQRGITNVVASLGTALTEAQGHLLRRYSNQVILGYDADGAGQEAILRGMDILQALGCDLRILQIEGAKDPDEFVTTYGVDKFKYYVNNAISLVEYKVKRLKQDLNLEIANDKIIFLKEIAKVISKVSNSIEQEVYIDKIAQEYGISKEAIRAEIDKLNVTQTMKTVKVMDKPTVAPVKSKEETEVINKAIYKREAMILFLLFTNPKRCYEKFKSNIKVEDFKYEKNKKIITKLYEELEKGNINTGSLLDYFNEDEEINNYISGILVYDFEIADIEKCVDDLIVTYEKERMINLKNDIIKKLENPKELTPDEKSSLEKQLTEIINKLAKIK